MESTLFLLLIGLLWVLSGMANGFVDHLQFRIQGPDKHPWYWSKFLNPTWSWTNKWKDGLAANGPRFFGSTSFLVFLTDGWHLGKMIMWAAAQAACTISTVALLEVPFSPWLTYPGIYFAFWLLRAGSFHITFHYLLSIPILTAMTRFFKSVASWFRALFTSAPFWISILAVGTVFFSLVAVGQISDVAAWSIGLLLILCNIAAIVYLVRRSRRKPPRT